MQIEEQKIVLEGRHLHRLVLHPDSAPRGTLVFFHGQGDYIDRYPPLLSIFVEQDFRCILTDLPGHGRSQGRRGSVPGMAFLDALLNSSLLDQPTPYLIAGHSMGGLVALRFFLNEPRRFAAAWFSSPLLDPMGQAKPWMRRTLPVLANLFPWIIVGTGVRTEDCTDDREGRPGEEDTPLYHSKVSIGWGRDLRDAAERIKQQLQGFPAGIPVLFTQGEIDKVCPPSILRARLVKLPENQITYSEIENARHEPFNGSTSALLQEALKKWVEKLTQRLPR